MRIFVTLLFLSLLGTQTQAETIRISLAELPNLSFYNEEHRLVGPFPKLIELLDEYHVDGDFDVKAYPFGRSLNNIVAGIADAHIPLINTGTNKSLPFQYVDEPLLTVTFVLYSHMDNPIKPTDDLRNLVLDTMTGHAEFFDFPINEVVDVETGLRKLINRRTDGFIMEQDAIDALIRQRSYNTTHREHFRTWASSIVVAKSRHGNAVNRKLSAAIRKMRHDPRYQLLADRVHAPFRVWQPHKQQAGNTRPPTGLTPEPQQACAPAHDGPSCGS